jgi:tetratricopeptide (TPR) repeat protein
VRRSRRLDAQALRTIAAAGGGRYIDVSGPDGALAPLASELRGLARTHFGDATNALPIERFQWFAAAALLLAVVELLLPLRRLLTRAGPRRAMRLWPIAGAGLFIGAMCAGGVAQVNRDGNRAYNAGDFDQALAHYKTAEAIDPSRPEPYHNAGNALDRNGDYNEAIDETKRALGAAATPGIEALAYALGGPTPLRLHDALDAYKRALLADPGDADAKHNLEVVIRLLTPAPTPRRPEATPPGGEGQQQGGTPGPGGASGTPAAGQPGTPSPSDQQPSQDELQRQLAEALQGIDQDLSREEALRILDLLERQNRRAAQEAAPGAGAGVPDY